MNNRSNDGQIAQAMSYNLGLSDMLVRIAITILVVCIHSVLIMVGRRIVFAGCKLLVNLLYKPKKKSKDVKPELSLEEEYEEEKDKNSEIEMKKSFFKRK